jgi:hypothetical protein
LGNKRKEHKRKEHKRNRYRILLNKRKRRVRFTMLCIPQSRAPWGKVYNALHTLSFFSIEKKEIEIAFFFL